MNETITDYRSCYAFDNDAFDNCAQMFYLIQLLCGDFSNQKSVFDALSIDVLNAVLYIIERVAQNCSEY